MRADTDARWVGTMEGLGLTALTTHGLGAGHGGRFRQDGLLLASRWDLEPIDIDYGLPWPERLLSAVVTHPAGRFEFHTAHVPNASSGITLYSRGEREAGAERLAKKLETFEGVARAMGETALPKILTGDFNTPHAESPDGRVRYWQHSCPPALRPQLQARWLAAERSVIEGLSDHGMIDVFRTLHGYGVDAYSWRPVRGDNTYRYDHVFASRTFKPLACEYHHAFRKSSSHHAGITADLEPSV